MISCCLNTKKKTIRSTGNNAIRIMSFALFCVILHNLTWYLTSTCILIVLQILYQCLILFLLYMYLFLFVHSLFLIFVHLCFYFVSICIFILLLYNCVFHTIDKSAMISIKTYIYIYIYIKQTSRNFYRLVWNRPMKALNLALQTTSLQWKMYL